jgi:hypothetical protein
MKVNFLPLRSKKTLFGRPSNQVFYEIDYFKKYGRVEKCFVVKNQNPTCVLSLLSIDPQKLDSVLNEKHQVSKKCFFAPSVLTRCKF